LEAFSSLWEKISLSLSLSLSLWSHYLLRLASNLQSSCLSLPSSWDNSANQLKSLNFLVGPQCRHWVALWYQEFRSLKIRIKLSALTLLERWREGHLEEKPAPVSPSQAHPRPHMLNMFCLHNSVYIPKLTGLYTSMRELHGFLIISQ
jgi:hypothetical protein